MDTLELFNRMVEALENSTLASNPNELNRLVGLVNECVEEIKDEKDPRPVGPQMKKSISL
jgi:hypothetical protein